MARLVPLPFSTFGEIAALGLKVEVHCPGRRRQVEIDPADERLRGRRFAGARLRCTATVQHYTASPPGVCGNLGYLSIKPRELLPVGGPIRLAFLFCRHGKSIRSSSTSRRGRSLMAISAAVIASNAQDAAAALIGIFIARRGGQRISS